jgi:hypothetical protein
VQAAYLSELTAVKVNGAASTLKLAALKIVLAAFKTNDVGVKIKLTAYKAKEAAYFSYLAALQINVCRPNRIDH